MSDTERKGADFMDVSALVEYLGARGVKTTPSGIKRLRLEHGLPFRRISPKRIVFHRDDIERWLASRPMEGDAPAVVGDSS